MAMKDISEATLEGFRLLERQLEMREKRQRQSLEETQKSLASLREQLKRS